MTLQSVGALKVWNGSEWVSGGEATPVAPSPQCVAFDCDNFSASANSLSWGNVPYEDGDLLVMAVLHRVAMTTPSGWTLHATVGPVRPTGVDQFTSILTRRMTGSGTASGTVSFTASERLAIGVLNIRDAGDVIERPDLCGVVNGDVGQTNRITLAGKGDTANLVIWALSTPSWSTSSLANTPFISVARTPWLSTPLMPAPDWASPNDNNQPRLGVFLDYGAAGPRRFTAPAGINAAAAVAAIEIANP